MVNSFWNRVYHAIRVLPKFMQRTLDSGRSFITSEELLFIHIDKTSLLKMPSGQDTLSYKMASNSFFMFHLWLLNPEPLRTEYKTNMTEKSYAQQCSANFLLIVTVKHKINIFTVLLISVNFDNQATLNLQQSFCLARPNPKNMVCTLVLRYADVICNAFLCILYRMILNILTFK